MLERSARPRLHLLLLLRLMVLVLPQIDKTGLSRLRRRRRHEEGGCKLWVDLCPETFLAARSRSGSTPRGESVRPDQLLRRADDCAHRAGILLPFCTAPFSTEIVVDSNEITMFKADEYVHTTAAAHTLLWGKSVYKLHK